MVKYPWNNKVVEITWVDACTSDKWRSRKEYLRITKPLAIKTVGYLIKKNKKCVAVVQSQGANDDYSDSMTIPRDWVQKIRRLK